MTNSEPKPMEEEDRPPIFQSWKQMYAFVLMLHAIIIILFYIFSQVYA